MGFMGWDFIEAEINLDHPSKEPPKKVPADVPRCLTRGKIWFRKDLFAHNTNLE